MIKELRQKKGYTQEQLARLLDVTLKHYQKIEYNKTIPNVKTGLKLAILLDSNPYKLWNVTLDEEALKELKNSLRF